MITTYWYLLIRFWEHIEHICINVHFCSVQFLIESSPFCKSPITVITQHQLVKLRFSSLSIFHCHHQQCLTNREPLHFRKTSVSRRELTFVLCGTHPYSALTEHMLHKYVTLSQKVSTVCVTPYSNRDTSFWRLVFPGSWLQWCCQMHHTANSHEIMCIWSSFCVM